MTPRFTSVILAAGMGTRLGLPEPKPLTEIREAWTILDQQLNNLDQAFGNSFSLALVTGHMAERFDFLAKTAQLVVNPRYAETNTSKSLLQALESIPPGPVLWMNGDVVFSEKVLPLCEDLVDSDTSFIVVNEADTADEEVKYVLNEAGQISRIGKQLDGARGEAVGINFVSSEHRDALTEALRQVGDQDYFEAAIQMIIDEGKASFEPVVIALEEAIEVDTGQDLSRALGMMDVLSPGLESTKAHPSG